MKFSLKCGQSWTTPSCFNNKRKLSKSRTIVSSPKPDEFQYLIPEVPVSCPTWSSHDHVCSRKTLLDELVLVRLYMLWYVQMSWVLLYIVIESEKTGIATSSLLCFMWSVCLTFWYNANIIFHNVWNNILVQFHVYHFHLYVCTL